FDWIEPPGHLAGFSRYLVNPDNVGSRYLDFRLSRYPPGGRVELHHHDVAEQVYLLLSGAAPAICGNEARDVDEGAVLFLPAGVAHSILNIGSEPLEFVVVSSPPGDVPR